MSLKREEKQSFDYFYKGDKLDVFVQNLDCYSAAFYFIMKYQFHLTEQVETYFMDDISYSFRMIQDEYQTIELNRLPMDEWVYDVEIHSPKTDKYEFIQQKADEHDFVVLETYCHRLKSSFLYTKADEYYNPVFDKNRRDHCFLVIDYDENGLHIVDEEVLVRSEYLKHICDNKSIYHLKKEYLLPALDAVCNVYIVTLNEERKEDIVTEAHFKRLLKRISDNYQREPYTIDNVTYYPGIKGLEKLLELQEQGKLQLFEKIDKEGFYDLAGTKTIVDDLAWELWCIEQKRYIFIQAMKWRSEETYLPLKKQLKKNFRAWNHFRKALLEAREQKLPELTKENISLLKKLIESERELVELLGR